MTIPITIDANEPSFPRTEWFLRLTDTGAATRLPAQIAVTSTVVELAPRHGDRILGQVNIGYSDRVVLLERTSHAGNEIISGIELQAIESSGALTTYLERVISGRSAERTLSLIHI